jgi:hypothetical protein
MSTSSFLSNLVALPLLSPKLYAQFQRKNSLPLSLKKGADCML